MKRTPPKTAYASTIRYDVRCSRNETGFFCSCFVRKTFMFRLLLNYAHAHSLTHRTGRHENGADECILSVAVAFIRWTRRWFFRDAKIRDDVCCCCCCWLRCGRTLNWWIYFSFILLLQLFQFLLCCVVPLYFAVYVANERMYVISR